MKTSLVGKNRAKCRMQIAWRLKVKTKCFKSTGKDATLMKPSVCNFV